MSVYGASATRDRQAWFFGLTGPQFFLVLAAGFPTWMAMAIGQWIALLGLVPLWAAVGLLICLPIRGRSAFQWIGVLFRHLAGPRSAGRGSSPRPLPATSTSATGRTMRTTATRARRTCPASWPASRSTTARR